MYKRTRFILKYFRGKVLDEKKVQPSRYKLEGSQSKKYIILHPCVRR